MNDLTRLGPQVEGCSAVKDRFLKFAATFEAKLLSGNEELGNDMGKIVFMVKAATDSATDSVISTEESIKQLEADKEHNVMTTGVEESAEDEVIAGKVYNVLRTMTDTHQVKHTHSGTFQNQCHYATGAKVQLTGRRGAFFNVLRATNRDWSSGTARR